MATPCIDFDMLASYFEGSLSDEDKVRMMAHLAECHTCLEKFASASSIMKNRNLAEWKPASEEVARHFLKHLSLPEIVREPPLHSGLFYELRRSSRDLITSFYRRIAVFVANLFRQPVSAYAPVRSHAVSSPDDICLTRKIDDLETEVYIEELENDKATIKVKVVNDGKNGKNISLTLIKDRWKVFARNLRNDFVRFEDIPPGSYQLILEQNGFEKGSCFFEISEDGLYEKDNLS
ncbi:zf-HC2 domain-containing protein [Desulfonema magnum]|uniref:Zinc finger-containing protein n=1 Tax=Desulfonema magnum TaxID=45655 RepID=A0A975BIR0_9BACT|nr:zf-HC2 domain-containing protein [Desulfonema magnum]QTA86091.1 Putative zinc finger-containing protein [Desulfonema magnum]